MKNIDHCHFTDFVNTFSYNNFTLQFQLMSVNLVEDYDSCPNRLPHLSYAIARN
jgi:hypothetical protein